MVKHQQRQKIKKQQQQQYFSDSDNQYNNYCKNNSIKNNLNIKSKQQYNQDSSSYDNDSSDNNNSYQYQYEQNQNSEEQDNNNQLENKMNQLKKQQQRIKQQLKQLPYELILKQKQQIQSQKQQVTRNIKKKKKIIKKDNKINQVKDKNAPKQLPIHMKPPKKVITIFQPKRAKTIDPRFQDYAGSYNQDLAMKAFDFIPKIQQQQINAIKNTLKSSKIPSSGRRNRGKNLNQKQKKTLQQQYNRLTNQRRQQQLLSIQKQAKHNIKQQYSKQNPNSYFNSSYIPRNKFKQEFQKVKISKMSQENRKEYLKNKQKKILKNQQVQRNNIMFETSQSRFKANNRMGKY